MKATNEEIRMESITKTWCPENAIKLVQNMSTFCVEQTDQLSHCEPEMDIIWCKIWTDCYPFEHTDSIIAGVWCMINSISGTTINLLTLLAIPYAKRHGRYQILFVKKDCLLTVVF